MIGTCGFMAMYRGFPDIGEEAPPVATITDSNLLTGLAPFTQP